MNKPRAGDAGDERDLQDLLVRSLDSLRESPADRERFPALDRMLSRIEARERRMASRQVARAWLRPLIGPLTAAAAGFAGAALALIVLPGPAPETAGGATALAVSQAPHGDTRDDLDRSIRRLENAVRGLEKFQPLLESRIEWVEDMLQRHVKGAFVAAEHRKDTRRGLQPAARLRRGDGV